jgi:hypothetical protein
VPDVLPDLQRPAQDVVRGLLDGLRGGEDRARPTPSPADLLDLLLG